jgi:hypothetical protein
LTTTASGPSLKQREVSLMYSLELSRAIAADRQRELEKALHHRRLLEILAVRAMDQAEDGQHPGGRTAQAGKPYAPALEQAR